MKLTITDKKLKNQVIRFLMVDNQQITFNTIVQRLEQHLQGIQGKLLDDLASFEKMLNLQWDVIIFHTAYDFNIQQAIEVIKQKEKHIPIIVVSDLDCKSDDALALLKLGIFQIVNIKHLDHLALNLHRATIFSRLIRREQQLTVEIDKLQQQTQTLVETTEYAVAIFQEGIHISHNVQYAALFGEQKSDAFVGLPILDIIQPENTQEFKQFFKRMEKGDFTQPSLTVRCLNPDSKENNLSLQFSATEFDDDAALQLVIINDVDNSKVAQDSNCDGFATLQDLYEQLNFSFVQNSKLALLVFSVQECALNLFESDWNSSLLYFKQIHQALHTLCGQDVIRIAENVYVALDTNVLQHNLTEYLSTLQQQLPRTLDVNGQLYPVHIQLGAQLLEQLPQLEELSGLLQHLFKQTLSIESTPTFALAEKESEVTPISFGETIIEQQPQTSTLSFGEPSEYGFVNQNTSLSGGALAETDLHTALLQQLDQNTIQLQFQQIYDKEDIDTHIYEVSAYFNHDNQNIDLDQLDLLKSNTELAVKVDRWVLVEASKRLHQFLSNCPKARIIVPLHAASLEDNSLLSLLSKLVNLINSKYTRPLMLQFNEQDVLTNLDAAAKFLQIIQEQNIGLTISDFGHSMYCVNILQQLNIKFAKLSPDFTQLLSSDDGLVELQEKLDGYKEHNEEVLFLLPELNEMNDFANAWNVDVRYLQGNYYQAQQNEFINSAG